jgi:hypothetical protein
MRKIKVTAPDHSVPCLANSGFGKPPEQSSTPSEGNELPRLSANNECGNKEEAVSGSQGEMGGAEEKGELALSRFAFVVPFLKI